MLVDMKESVSWTDANPVLVGLGIILGSTVMWNLGIVLLAWVWHLSQ